MKKLYIILVFISSLATSCHKELGTGGEEQNSSFVPADFDWKTTRDVSVIVNMPSESGSAPQYALVRIYTSPVLSDDNMVAYGVTKPSASFNTAITIPAAVEDLYVQTTLPDGSKSVAAYAVAAQISVTATAVKSAMHSPAVSRTRVVTESSMPEVPWADLVVKSASDFNEKAIIRTTPTSTFNLGHEWSPYAAAEYYIPAGVEITGNVNLNGTFSPYPNPVLYVSGKLTVQSLQIGKATLVVQPGGEVIISGNLAANQQYTNAPAVYVFAGGSLKSGSANFSNNVVVNQGAMQIGGLLDINNSCTLYNTVSASLSAGSFKVSNSAKFYNDGNVDAGGFEANGSSQIYNCENGSMKVENTFYFTNNVTVYQRGELEGTKLMISSGTIYVNCYTKFDEVDTQYGTINIASGAALEAGSVKSNNTTVSMGAGSLFVMENYNLGINNASTFKSTAQAGETPAVVVIEGKANNGNQWYGTSFSGNMEVVYDNAANASYTIHPAWLKNGATMSAEQTAVIAACDCNGNRNAVVPEPVDEPDSVVSGGAVYTYCFEDGWPWMGDYDMNDVVLALSVERHMSADGSKVNKLVFNWELKAAGAANYNAFAVQLDNVAASQVASVETTNRSFGSGPFGGSGLEAGHNLAVIPFFNSVQEIFGQKTYVNTQRGGATVPSVMHATTVTFAQAVDASAVVESAINAFIVVNQRNSGFSRANEVHMPTYKPTRLGVVTGYKTIATDEPYKYFVTRGEGMKNNYMMWALMIPGDFRYPAERCDIRDAYVNFSAWAASGGASNRSWYNGETVGSMIY